MTTPLTPTQHESALAAACAAATGVGSTNPWGVLRGPLAVAAGVPSRAARAIGMQDDSVIDRAINSPGMVKPNIKVHGYCVYPATNYGTALAHVKQAVETQPNLHTAVLMDGNREYRPCDVVSRDPDVAAALEATLPHATLTMVQRDVSASTGTAPTGPWSIVLDDERLDQRAASILIGLEEANVRHISPGDRVLLVDADGAAHAAGVVASMTHDQDALVLSLQPVRYFPDGPQMVGG
jgi:hypothetical protein